MDDTMHLRCPSCQVAMRDHERGWQCPVCGVAEIVVELPRSAYQSVA